ncbi:hypothetical protein FOMPIDRAFT_1130245 [Fomitopsis schrenkii]|uniref:Uncharacterized protein n=1 Tax=Fomitopsis schrenkii TaxID=2126942 RepID=S8F4E6_FOMSC|nr:hypothetical protein FOMPIDRAFT_1130245 [Fomitopsis schrenkii]
MGKHLHTAAGDKLCNWPRHLNTELRALRTTVLQVMGYTPYYLLYSKQWPLPFDLIDCTWFRLKWDKVQMTEDLLITHLQQIKHQLHAEACTAHRVRQVQARNLGACP